MSGSAELLRAEGLSRRYALRRRGRGNPAGEIAAVDRVSFRIARGETLGLVGESGSGKTTTGRLVLRLEEPDSGRIWLEGEDWLALRGEALRRRRRDVQIVFQDPQTSLNPRMTSGDQVAEPLRVQRMASPQELPGRIRELLAEVGLPSSVAARFPAELSGGQRQRVAIARALATRPRLVVCDEPVSSLDVSVAAQIVNLLLDLRDRNGLSYLFISHDLALVRRLADRIAVMYRGRIVEEGPAARVVAKPRHPYTAALLSAVREPDLSAAAARIHLPADSAAEAVGPGCVFFPRCPIARPRCRDESPPWNETRDEGGAACFYPEELQPEKL
jgi:peptide/nickel transport system ATP-binding protein/oligopeptide transport system ATP-binding protein